MDIWKFKVKPLETYLHEVSFLRTKQAKIINLILPWNQALKRKGKIEFIQEWKQLRSLQMKNMYLVLYGHIRLENHTSIGQNLCHSTSQCIVGFSKKTVLRGHNSVIKHGNKTKAMITTTGRVHHHWKICMMHTMFVSCVLVFLLCWWHRHLMYI